MNNLIELEVPRSISFEQINLKQHETGGGEGTTRRTSLSIETTSQVEVKISQRHEGVRGFEVEPRWIVKRTWT